MSEFELAFDTIPVKTKARWITWMMKLTISDKAKESIAYEELKEVLGTFDMMLPCDPIPGDVISYNGRLWQVECRILSPTRYQSKQKKYIPTAVCSYVEKLSVE